MNCANTTLKLLADGFAICTSRSLLPQSACMGQEKRYTNLADNLEAGKVFRKKGKGAWRCLNCGYLHEAEEAHPP
ncbi:MAG: hypothetical protein KAU22_12740 [Desulfuromonadales bacterium]|nr:hypothetical protein [Desulfuromonadales bacterium]